MKLKIFFPVLILLILVSCSIPVDAPPPLTALPTVASQPALTAAPAFTPIPLLTQVATSLPTSSSNTATSFCDDSRARDLIASFSKAIANKDGALLSSLVSPATGMDVRFYRNGNVVNYDVQHAKFVFETTFQADWGLAPGSGQSTLGSFHDLILPSLQAVFTSNAELLCNQIKIGGASYNPVWSYQGMNYYSVYFPGTDQYNGMDWQTWVVGMDMSSGGPMLAVLMRFAWEP